ncbi:MAG: TylF/MycF family methyltransferase [Oligoflexia bacterium]|nr:TylF/MycF family methyltransferase [Oligoflexia bacterium]
MKALELAALPSRNGPVDLAKDGLFGARYLLRNWRALRAREFSPSRLAKVMGIARYTQVTPPGLKTLFQLLDRIEHDGIAGDLVECGVWRGGVAALICDSPAGRKRTTWLFDSFEGMPEGTAEDSCGHSSALARGRLGGKLAPVGTNVATPEFLVTLLRRFRADLSRVRVFKGWFQETLPVAVPEMGPIALLRIDGDFYASTKVCLEQLYPKVAPGGCVIIDDYNTFEGCRKAVQEYFGGKTPELHEISQEQGVWFVRTL